MHCQPQEKKKKKNAEMRELRAATPSGFSQRTRQGNPSLQTVMGVCQRKTSPVCKGGMARVQLCAKCLQNEENPWLRQTRTQEMMNSVERGNNSGLERTFQITLSSRVAHSRKS